ncbi:hypothetical protein [Paenibacillus gansuensis]|uniref:Uncharacterized protein n=1 Tax=Paenibacillus gansuensis TaxID=306542 RepID=A0ABW5P7F1_9BACL
MTKHTGTGMKPWKKWMLGSAAAVLLLVLGGAGYLYYQIQSITTADILQRHPEPGESGDSSQDKPAAQVPKPLYGAVDKAGELANQSINSKDAMDVAAVLLRSGLSMKEIMYLQGNATEKLSNEKKQEIRDLLLKKLSPEEIKALRAVTHKYGKGLVILDPEYPIELVGVYDEKERARIKEELKKKAQSTGAGDAADTGNVVSAGSDKNTSGKASDHPDLSQDNNEVKDEPKTAAAKPNGTSGNSGSKGSTGTSGSSGSTGTSGTSGSSSARKAAERRYEGKLASLRSSCRSKSSAIIGQIKSEVSGGSVSLKTLQSKFLPKVAAAESSCDAKFESIIGSAVSEFKSNGWSQSAISRWRSEYNSSKAEMQASAAAQISSMMN